MTTANSWFFAYFIRLRDTTRATASVSGAEGAVETVRRGLLRDGYVEITYWEWIWWRLFRRLPDHVAAYTPEMTVDKTPHTDAMWAPGGEGELRPRGQS